MTQHDEVFLSFGDATKVLWADKSSARGNHSLTVVCWSLSGRGDQGCGVCVNTIDHAHTSIKRQPKTNPSVETGTKESEQPSKRATTRLSLYPCHGTHPPSICRVLIHGANEKLMPALQSPYPLPQDISLESYIKEHEHIHHTKTASTHGCNNRSQHIMRQASTDTRRRPCQALLAVLSLAAATTSAFSPLAPFSPMAMTSFEPCRVSVTHRRRSIVSSTRL